MWWEKYIGLPYNDADCAELVRRINANEFNRTVDLPSNRDPGIRGVSRQINRELATYGEATECPIDGDCVVMTQGSRLAHVGCYVEIGGKHFVLHALRTAGATVLHSFRAVRGIGLEIRGVYRLKEVEHV